MSLSSAFFQLSKSYTYKTYNSATFYKTYSRLPQVVLPEVDKYRGRGLFEILECPRSKDRFTRVSPTPGELSAILHCVWGVKEKMPGETHQTRGGGFPLEIYIFILVSSKEFPAGIYHYNPREHGLSVLWKREFSKEEIDNLFVHPWIEYGSMVVVITARFLKGRIKFGERGHLFAWLWGGHVGQNLYLASEALGIQCCALSEMKDAKIEEVLEIDGITESVIYGAVIGK